MKRLVSSVFWFVLFYAVARVVGRYSQWNHDVYRPTLLGLIFGFLGVIPVWMLRARIGQRPWNGAVWPSTGIIVLAALAAYSVPRISEGHEARIAATAVITLAGTLLLLMKYQHRMKHQHRVVASQR